MKEVYIVAAGRTAVGSFGGSLAKISAAQLGAIVIKDLIRQIQIPVQLIDEVIMGQVLTAGVGQNPARQASINAGIPYMTPAMTINKVCGSGLKALHLATQAIRLGDAEIIIAGGQENMSLAPHVLPNSRNGQRMGDYTLIDSMIYDGLWDVFNNYHMGITAENVVNKYGLNRVDIDQFALESHQKAVAAQNSGRFDAEIIPVTLSQPKGATTSFNKDEGPRPNISLELMARLNPVFKKDGIITAGNSSSINDGAAAVILCNEDKLKELKLNPLAKIVAYASAGVEPEIMGTGPIPATRRCLVKAGWGVNELDLIEANEAFAAQTLVVNDALGWDTSKVNVNGGSIAIGHPIGASGCRILVTLVHEMIKRNAKKGLATLCIGGGQGVALAIER